MYRNTQHGGINNFTNPSSSPFIAQYLILISHITPLIALISIPEIISSI
jgi:hypothetical protein